MYTYSDELISDLHKADNISQIPLSDINSFLNGLEDQMNQQDYYNSVEDM